MHNQQTELTCRRLFPFTIPNLKKWYLPRPVISVQTGAQGDGTMDNPAMSQCTQTEYNKDYTTKKKPKPFNKWRMVRSAYKTNGRLSGRQSRNRKELKAHPSVGRLPSIPSLPSISSLYEPAPETMEPICSHSCGIKKQREISPRGSSPNTPKIRRRSLRDVGPKVDCWRSFRPTATVTVEKKDSKLRLQSMLSVVDLLLSASKKENWILRASGYLLALKKEIKFCLDNKILPKLTSTNDLPTLYEPKINYKEFNPRRKFYGYVRRLRFDDFYDDEIPHEPCKTLQHETRFLPMVDPTTDIIETKLSVRPKATDKCLDNDNSLGKGRGNPNENLYDILKSYCIGKSAMQHYIPGPIEHDFIEEGRVDEPIPEDEEKRLEIKLSSFLKEMFSFSPSSNSKEKSADRPGLDVADILKRLQMESSKEKNKTHSNDHYSRHEENFYRSKTIKRGNKQLSPSKTPLITSVKLSELIYDNKSNITSHRHTTEGTSNKKDPEKRFTSPLDARLKREFESLEMKLRGTHNKLTLKESAHLSNIIDKIKRVNHQNRKSAAELKTSKKSSQAKQSQPKNSQKELKFYNEIIAQSSNLPDAVCFSRIKKLLRVYKEKQVDEKIRSLITDFSDDQKYGELKENILRLNEVIGNLAKANKDVSHPLSCRLNKAENDPTEESTISGLEARETINELIQIIDNIKDISRKVYAVKKGDIPYGKIPIHHGKKGKKRHAKRKQKGASSKKLQGNSSVIQEQKVFSSRRGLMQDNFKGQVQRSKTQSELEKSTESNRQLPNKGNSLKSLNASSGSCKQLQPKSLKNLVPDSTKSSSLVSKGSKGEASSVSQLSRKGQKSCKGLQGKSSKRCSRRKGHKSGLHRGSRRKRRSETVKGLKLSSRKKIHRRSRKTLKSGLRKKLQRQSKKGGLAHQQEPNKVTQSKSTKTLQPGINSKSQAEIHKLTSSNTKTKGCPGKKRKIPSLKKLVNNAGIKPQLSKGRINPVVQNVNKISSEGTSQLTNSKQINRQKSIMKHLNQAKNNHTPKETPGDLPKTLTHKHDCVVSKSVLEAIKKNPKYIETAVENILKRSHSKQSLISMLLQVIHARLESENGESLGCGDRSKTNRNKADDMFENISVTELSFNSPNVSCHSFNYLKNLYDKSTNSFGDELTKSLAKSYQLKKGKINKEQGVVQQAVGDAGLSHPNDAMEKKKKRLPLPIENVRVEERAKPTGNKQIKKLPVRNKKIVKADKGKTSPSQKTVAMKGKSIHAKHFI